MKNTDFLFRGKYNPETARLKGYDYSQAGLYFVTICCHNRGHIFGEIQENDVMLSQLGIQVEKCIKQIPKHFDFVFVDEYVVMPNHIHIILKFQNQTNVETQYFASEKPNIFGPQSQNLASVIRGLKIGVTKYARKNTDIYTVWQTRYHDRIIRDENEYLKIKEYIQNNPKNWEQDSLFS